MFEVASASNLRTMESVVLDRVAKQLTKTTGISADVADTPPGSADLILATAGTAGIATVTEEPDA